jgi:hypothetical protein
MVFSISLFTVLVAVLFTHSLIRAVRADHLLHFYWGEGELFLFVHRGVGRRYDRIHLWAVPGVVYRFETSRLRARLRTPRPAPALASATRPPQRFARLAH